mmetsp:Transcript_18716/g.71201  ORF Transcript_18716/g.71201 Transcript_18716/m.71201 type:complete len:283 (+) Transcript_18716:1307-2155(+)
MRAGPGRPRTRRPPGHRPARQRHLPPRPAPPAGGSSASRRRPRAAPLRHRGSITGSAAASDRPRRLATPAEPWRRRQRRPLPPASPQHGPPLARRRPSLPSQATRSSGSGPRAGATGRCWGRAWRWRAATAPTWLGPPRCPQPAASAPPERGPRAASRCHPRRRRRDGSSSQSGGNTPPQPPTRPSDLRPCRWPRSPPTLAAPRTTTTAPRRATRTTPRTTSRSAPPAQPRPRRSGRGRRRPPPSSALLPWGGTPPAQPRWTRACSPPCCAARRAARCAFPS